MPTKVDSNARWISVMAGYDLGPVQGPWNTQSTGFDLLGWLQPTSNRLRMSRYSIRETLCWAWFADFASDALCYAAVGENDTPTRVAQVVQSAF